MITCVNVGYILDVSEPLPISFFKNEVTNISTSSCNTSPNVYVQFWSPDDGRKNRLKLVERLTGTNKFEERCIFLVVLWEYFSDVRTYEC